MSRGPVVHQFTAVLAGRDAVGHHTVAVDSLLREMGCRTATFAAHVSPDAGLRAEHYREHGRHPPPDLILYQLSTGSPVGNYLLARPEPLILNYHNITPAEAFDVWAPQVGAELADARHQLARLARRSRGAIADSYYNAAELRALGMREVAVAPIIWHPPERPRRRRPTTPESPVVLFVGRVAPNKRHEDLIGALALLRTSRPGARLVLVGANTIPSYESALRDFTERLGLDRSVEFAGSVTSEMLHAHYSSASVYASASVHEGFGVPLIEAMSVGIPIVARAAAAVPETVGDAGLLIDSEGPIALAAAIDRVLSDTSLRDELVTRGHRRAATFNPAAVRQRMRAAFEPLLAAL